MRGGADWPNLESVSIKLPSRWIMFLEPVEVGILYRLVDFIAGSSVNTYSEADPDPRLPDNDQQLKNIAFCSKRQWNAFKPKMGEFFVLSAGAWRLKENDVIRISRPMTREAISVAVKSIVLARDGQRCVYCGSIEGPFHFDHLYPVSRGGSNAVSNIVLACAACNLAKSDRTLAEWVGR